MTDGSSSSVFISCMTRRLFHLLRLACAALLLGWVLHRLRWEEVMKFDWRKVELRWLAVSLLLGGLRCWAGREGGGGSCGCMTCGCRFVNCCG